jgi:hypothetical protein
VISIGFLQITVYEPPRQAQLIIIYEGIFYIAHHRKVYVLENIYKYEGNDHIEEKAVLCRRTGNTPEPAKYPALFYGRRITYERYQFGYKGHSHKFKDSTDKKAKAQKYRCHLLSSVEYIVYLGK